ncbi:MAG: hypothetical protein L6Q34_01880 [Nitrospira sp.]|nr:MAG: hypothetical protein UZ03_NOB001003549 [Nitrospira sp. OLB3]MCK6492158.1 hypothetical protein [Nitrospira sp.]MCK6500472.1 hypothetical protein [Nitrospira sp.]MEB2339410.1 hypothetical protein [Nitrospirales bacterium]QOJ36049.1 MAG: hypothetical protein HRU82_14345 [Nitrospira sp.]
MERKLRRRSGSSPYRFHNVRRTERKFLFVAVTSAIILMMVLSGLMFDIYHIH